MRSGNNTNIDLINASDNPNLKCIFVDSITFSQTNWTQIDPGSTFVETETQCSTLSAEEFSSQLFSIYPNPTSQNLFINGELEIDRIEIINIFGQKVYQTNTATVDTSSLTKGTYILRVAFVSGAKAVRKFIKT